MARGQLSGPASELHSRHVRTTYWRRAGVVASFGEAQASVTQTVKKSVK